MADGAELVQTAIIDELRAAFDASTVLTGADIGARYHTDMAGIPVAPPLAVMRPRSTEEVSKFLKTVPCGPRAGDDARRHDRPGARHHAVTGRNRAVDGAHDRDRGGRYRRRGRHHADRRAAAAPAGARRPGRLYVPARSRRARQLHDRRQHLHQCRRQSRDPLRHDARSRARARGRAGRRHGRQGRAQIHQEQHRQ